MTKQVIVVRKDLNMQNGKMGAQVSHASMGAFFNSLNLDFQEMDKNKDINLNLLVNKESPVFDFITGSFTKIVLMVKDEKRLMEIYDLAKKNKLPISLIKDEGRTVFTEPTVTCLGIGPATLEDIDKVTGTLKLYR